MFCVTSSHHSFRSFGTLSRVYLLILSIINLAIVPNCTFNSSSSIVFHDNNFWRVTIDWEWTAEETKKDSLTRNRAKNGTVWSTDACPTYITDLIVRFPDYKVCYQIDSNSSLRNVIPINLICSVLVFVAKESNSSHMKTYRNIPEMWVPCDVFMINQKEKCVSSHD